MEKVFAKYRVLLASNSPRRQELLRLMDVPFTVVTKPGLDESYPAGLKPELVPEYLARRKADAYAGDLTAGDMLITADTVVIADCGILGKPRTEEDARLMLRELCGKFHKVVTGVAITTKDRQKAFSAKTKVFMRALSDEQIDYYVRVYRPLDKAGAYGIQEWIGMVAIEHIEGSFQNVMGLPTQRLAAVLATF